MIAKTRYSVNVFQTTFNHLIIFNAALSTIVEVD